MGEVYYANPNSGLFNQYSILLCLNNPGLIFVFLATRINFAIIMSNIYGPDPCKKSDRHLIVLPQLFDLCWSLYLLLHLGCHIKRLFWKKASSSGCPRHHSLLSTCFEVQGNFLTKKSVNKHGSKLQGRSQKIMTERSASVCLLLALAPHKLFTVSYCSLHRMLRYESSFKIAKMIIQNFSYLPVCFLLNLHCIKPVISNYSTRTRRLIFRSGGEC